MIPYGSGTSLEGHTTTPYQGVLRADGAATADARLSGAVSLLFVFVWLQALASRCHT